MRDCRSDFPMLEQKVNGKPLLYLDSAATTLKPHAVIQATNAYYSEEYGTVHRAVYSLAQMATEKYNSTRTQVKNFLKAQKEEEILFTRSTTESINLVAFSFGEAFISKGDEIVITQTEHHSNIVPWQLLAQRKKAHLKVIPVHDEGTLDLHAMEKIITSKTKLVALAHVANSTGIIHPIKKVIDLAHQKGAYVLIDGAQSAPRLKTDVQELDCDFYACSGHKLYGPTGIGILYGKEALLERMPPYQGGGDMIERVTFKETLFQKPPLKFEAGTPNIAGVIGLGAALEYLEAIGIEAIEKHEKRLLDRLTDSLLEIPHLQIIGTSVEKCGIISFVIPPHHPLDMATLLDLEGIALRSGHHCAQPTMDRFGVSSTLRASLGLYNTSEEIDSFVFALKKVIKKLS